MSKSPIPPKRKAARARATRRRGYEVVVVGIGSNGPATIFQARIIRDHVASQWTRDRGWDVVVRRSPRPPTKGARRGK